MGREALRTWRRPQRSGQTLYMSLRAVSIHEWRQAARNGTKSMTWTKYRRLIMVWGLIRSNIIHLLSFPSRTRSMQRTMGRESVTFTTDRVPQRARRLTGWTKRLAMTFSRSQTLQTHIFWGRWKRARMLCEALRGMPIMWMVTGVSSQILRENRECNSTQTTNKWTRFLKCTLRARFHRLLSTWAKANNLITCRTRIWSSWGSRGLPSRNTSKNTLGRFHSRTMPLRLSWIIRACTSSTIKGRIRCRFRAVIMTLGRCFRRMSSANSRVCSKVRRFTQTWAGSPSQWSRPSLWRQHTWPTTKTMSRTKRCPVSSRASRSTAQGGSPAA